MDVIKRAKETFLDVDDDCSFKAVQCSQQHEVEVTVREEVSRVHCDCDDDDDDAAVVV